MELTSILAIVTIIAGLTAIISFVLNNFFGQRTLSQLLRKRNKPSRDGDTNAIRKKLPHRDHKILWGREEELQKIFRLLQPYPKSRYHIIVIEGIGGIGKTALALEVAYRIRQGEFNGQTSFKFDSIVWASAKPSDLKSGGIMLKSYYIRLIEDVYATIAVTLGEPQILQAKREHQDELVRAALTKHRVLLILDNIEVLADDSIISFIQDVPDPTKVIVTTRHRVDAGFPIILQGLDLQSSLALIQKEAEEPGGVNLPEDVALSIYEKTGGVPLAMVWTLGRLRLVYEPELVLKDLANPSSDISRFCFEQSMSEIRGKKAWELLYAISIFRKGAKKEAIGFICNLLDSQLDLNDGLVLLTRLSLINQDGGRFTALLLTRTYVQEVVQRETSDLGAHLKTRFADYYAFLLRSQVGSGYWDGRFALNTWSRFGVVVDELDEVREAIDIAYDQERWDVVRDLVFGIVHILWALDRWEQRIELTKIAIRAVQQLGLLEDEAWLRIDALGFIYLAQGDYDNAARTVEEGLRIAKSSGNNDAIVLGLCFKARILAHLEKYDEAQEILNQAKDIPADQWLKSRIDTTATLIAKGPPRKVSIGQGIPRSRIELEQQRKQLKEMLAQARRLRRKGAFVELRDLLKIAEKIEDDIGDLELRARIRLELGLLELDSRNFEEGQKILKDVREVFVYLGKNDEVSAINARLRKEIEREAGK